MREAAKHLIGTHDFTSFCATKTEVQDKVRTIYELDWTETDDGLQMRITGAVSYIIWSELLRVLCLMQVLEKFLPLM